MDKSLVPSFPFSFIQVSGLTDLIISEIYEGSLSIETMELDVCNLLCPLCEDSFLISSDLIMKNPFLTSSER